MLRIRTFLFCEALAFGVAALVHAGLLFEGYEHRDAILFESVLGGVLFLGYLLTRLNPSWTRQYGIVVQGIALFGTVNGRFSIIAGASRLLMFDLVFYRAITAVLLWGLIVSIIATTRDGLGFRR